MGTSSIRENLSGDGGPSTGTSELGDASETKDLVTGSYRRDGEHIGRFRIVEEIAKGKGGMGRVFKARDESLDRLVVIKLMRARLQEYGTAEQLAQRFRDEAVVAANIAHPNIITIYERGEHQGHEYFVMEYMDRGSLDDLVQAAWDTSEASIDAGGPPVFIPLETLHDYFLQATAGLRALHERGYIHRDIKLANFLLAERPGGGVALKLADFGVVRKPNSELTYDGSMLGTARYMAPEYFEITADGLPTALDHRSDLYALGLAIYECLTLWYPFHGVKDVRDANAKHRKKVRPVLPSRLRPELPSGWDYVTMSLLERDRERRYQSASAVYNDILNIDKLGPYLGDAAASDEETARWIAKTKGDSAQSNSSSSVSPARRVSGSPSGSRAKSSAKFFASSSLPNPASVVPQTMRTGWRQWKRLAAAIAALLTLVGIGSVLWFGRIRNESPAPPASKENDMFPPGMTDMGVPAPVVGSGINPPPEPGLERTADEAPAPKPATKIKPAKAAVHRSLAPSATQVIQKPIEPTPTRRLGSRFFVNPREVEEKKRAAAQSTHHENQTDSPAQATPSETTTP